LKQIFPIQIINSPVARMKEVMRENDRADLAQMLANEEEWERSVRRRV